MSRTATVSAIAPVLLVAVVPSIDFEAVAGSLCRLITRKLSW